MKKNQKRLENICLFTPKDFITEEDLGVINFVKEVACPTTSTFITGALFKMCVVTGGTGIFRTAHFSYTLKRGDIFLILPAAPHYISNVEGLEYMFISFSSIHAYHLIDVLDINSKTCFFPQLHHIVQMWETMFQFPDINIELSAHGLLYVTLAHFGRKQSDNSKPSKFDSSSKKILQIINENYCDADFTLSALAEKLGYTQKYTSDLFKKLFQVSFTRYLMSLRVNNAIELITSGFTSVKEIAQLSGYNDQLYFSKIFKLRTGLSPKEYIENERKSISVP